MPHPGITAAEPPLKSAHRRVDELEALLERALEIHSDASEALLRPTRWDAAASLQALSEVLVGVIDIVRAQHGVYDEADTDEADADEADAVRAYAA